MSPLAVRVGAGVLALLALIALRGKRWAYFAFVVLGLAYFPAQAHFRVHVPKCAQIFPTLPVLVLSPGGAVSRRARPRGVYRRCTSLRAPPGTFHRAESRSSQRRTSLRRKRSRRARGGRGGRGRRAERSLYVERSCNAFRRSWD